MKNWKEKKRRIFNSHVYWIKISLFFFFPLSCWYLILIRRPRQKKTKNTDQVFCILAFKRKKRSEEKMMKFSCWENVFTASAGLVPVLWWMFSRQTALFLLLLLSPQPLSFTNGNFSSSSSSFFLEEIERSLTEFAYQFGIRGKKEISFSDSWFSLSTSISTFMLSFIICSECNLISWNI